VGEVQENSLIGSLVKFSAETRIFNQIPDEMIHLGFLAYTGTSEQCDGFEIIPHEGRGNFTFEIRVSDSSILDYKTIQLVRLKVCGLESFNEGISPCSTNYE
jgi:hypothetical protein